MDTKYTLSSTEARQHFSELVQQVEESGARYTLTVNGRPKAVLVNAEELEGLEETLDIMSDTKTITNLKAGLRELNKGDWISLDEFLANDALSI